MTRNKRHLFVGLCSMIIVAFITGVAISGECITITGTVNETLQIVADDGQVYEVGDTEKGDEVVDLIDKKVKVTGTVEQSEGMKIIFINTPSSRTMCVISNFPIKSVSVICPSIIWISWPTIRSIKIIRIKTNYCPFTIVLNPRPPPRFYCVICPFDHPECKPEVYGD